MSKKIQKIVSVTTSLATIAWLSGIGMLAPIQVGAVTLADGDLIRNPSASGLAQFDIYIVKLVGAEKFKRLILSPHVFESYKHFDKNKNGNPWDDVITVDQATMDAYTTSDLVRADGDYKVYKLIADGDTGTKQWLNMTAEQFVAAGYDWDSIYIINTVDRDAYSTGSDIGPGVAVGALTVALASDTPPAGVAPANASRVATTKVNFTNTSGSSVTINSLTVERTGLAVDAAISTIMLIDAADNTQIDLNQALNALHQAVFNDDIVIPAGATKSIIIAANMPASTAAYAGQIFYLSLVAVNTTASLSGTLPITGNYQAINGTLAIGTATITRGSLDPGTTANKEVGTLAYNFTGLKVTAGSVEDMSLGSVRFYQAGSAASSDLANLKVTVDGTDYAATVSSDGKYYTASFAGGITIGKGLSKEITIKGDIVGGSGRQIEFKVYRNTDLVVKGTTYGYYRTVSATADADGDGTVEDGEFGSGTPFYEAYAVTIGSGTLRVDKNSTAAPAANITEGGTGVVLGAFDFVVLGEEVRSTSIILDIDYTPVTAGVGSSSDITNIVLAKSDGTVLAGPVNASDIAYAVGTEGDGTATFTGTVSFPVGTTAVIVKGNLNTDVAANDTIVVGFNDPYDRITNVTGAITGNSINTSPDSDVWANTMTVKAGSLTVKVSGTPATQAVVRGVVGFTFANFILDATGSGEDLRVTYMEVQHGAYTASTQSFIQTMQLFDGSTALNTGTNVINPSNSATASSTLTFTLNTPLVITKGTIKTIALKGNISGAATACSHEFGLSATDAENDMNVTGVSTGQDIGESITAANGQKMDIITAGQWSAALDAGSPTAKLAAAGTTGVEFTKLRLRATGEQVTVTNLRIQLTSASSTGVDLASITLWDGSTQLASTIFVGAGGASGAVADVVLSPGLVIPKNDEKVLTIKGDLALVGTGNPGTSGHRISIDYDASTATANYGTGADSGTKIYGFSTTGADTAANLVTMHKSVPTVARIALSSNKLANSSALAIYKFKVTADAKGDIDLYKVTFQVATTSATATNFTLVDVTESAEVTVQNDNTGANNNTDINMVLEYPDGTTAARTIAAGTSKTFELRCAIAGAGTGSSMSVQLQGDTAVIYTAAGTYMLTAANVDATAQSDDDFIWSDRSADAHGSGTADWTNAFLVSGLPSSNLTPEVLSY